MKEYTIGIVPAYQTGLIQSLFYEKVLYLLTLHDMRIAVPNSNEILVDDKLVFSVSNKSFHQGL